MRSGKFRLGRWHCHTLMVMEHAAWAGWTYLAVSVLLAVAGFIISPWAGIAAIAVDAFLGVMLVSFIIMAYGLHSITGTNTPLHSISQDDKTVRVEFEDGKEVEVAKADIRPYRIYPGGVVVPVGGSRAGWLWVPPKAFDTPDEFRTFLKALYQT